MDVIVMLVAGLLGLVMHWTVRWSRGDITCDLKTYLAKEKRYTVASLATLLSAVAAVYAASEAVAITKQTVAMIFMAGFMIDNTMNKAPQ